MQNNHKEHNGFFLFNHLKSHKMKELTMLSDFFLINRKIKLCKT